MPLPFPLPHVLLLSLSVLRVKLQGKQGLCRCSPEDAAPSTPWSTLAWARALRLHSRGFGRAAVSMASSLGRLSVTKLVAGAGGLAALLGGVALADNEKAMEKQAKAMFDPDALERGAKALREINKSPYAKQVNRRGDRFRRCARLGPRLPGRQRSRGHATMPPMHQGGHYVAYVQVADVLRGPGKTALVQIIFAILWPRSAETSFLG
jgi:hypothetical protein